MGKLIWWPMQMNGSNEPAKPSQPPQVLNRCRMQVHTLIADVPLQLLPFRLVGSFIGLLSTSSISGILTRSECGALDAGWVWDIVTEGMG